MPPGSEVPVCQLRRGDPVDTRQLATHLALEVGERPLRYRAVTRFEPATELLALLLNSRIVGAVGRVPAEALAHLVEVRRLLSTALTFIPLEPRRLTKPRCDRLSKSGLLCLGLLLICRRIFKDYAPSPWGRQSLRFLAFRLLADPRFFGWSNGSNMALVRSALKRRRCRLPFSAVASWQSRSQTDRIARIFSNWGNSCTALLRSTCVT